MYHISHSIMNMYYSIFSYMYTLHVSFLRPGTSSAPAPCSNEISCSTALCRCCSSSTWRPRPCPSAVLEWGKSFPAKMDQNAAFHVAWCGLDCGLMWLSVV